MRYDTIHSASLVIQQQVIYYKQLIGTLARRAGSDGSTSASGSAGPGFDPR